MEGLDMSTARPWVRGARIGAVALLGFGLILPVMTACSSSAESPEQVEQTGDLEETDPEPDIEE